MKGSVASSDIVINKPAEEIFNFTLNLDKLHTWSGSIDSKKATEALPKIGTKFYETYAYRAHKEKADCEIATLTKNKEWTYSFRLGSYTGTAGYKFDEVSKNKTKVTAAVELETANLLRMSIWYHLTSKLTLKKQINKNLNNLKQILETA